MQFVHAISNKIKLWFISTIPNEHDQNSNSTSKEVYFGQYKSEDK